MKRLRTLENGLGNHLHLSFSHAKMGIQFYNFAFLFAEDASPGVYPMYRYMRYVLLKKKEPASFLPPRQGLALAAEVPYKYIFNSYA